MSISVPTVEPIPDTYTPVTRFGAVLIAAMQPWMTLHLAWFCDWVGAMMDPVFGLVMGQGVDDGNTPTVGTYVNGELVTEGYQPGYGALLNPLSPNVDLGFLSNFLGVSIPTGASAETALSLIMAESGLNRATPAAVIAAAKRNLTGTQSVKLIERMYVDGTPSAGHFLLLVRPEEVISESALIAAVNAVKLGGLVWYLIQTDGTTWADETHTWTADALTWAQKG